MLEVAGLIFYDNTRIAQLIEPLLWYSTTHVKQLPELKAREKQRNTWPDAGAVNLQSACLLPCPLLLVLAGSHGARDVQNVSHAKEWV